MLEFASKFNRLFSVPITYIFIILFVSGCKNDEELPKEYDPIEIAVWVRYKEAAQFSVIEPANNAQVFVSWLANSGGGNLSGNTQTNGDYGVYSTSFDTEGYPASVEVYKINYKGKTFTINDSETLSPGEFHIFFVQLNEGDED